MKRIHGLLAISLAFAAACSKRADSTATSTPSFAPPSDKTPARELLHKEAPRAVVESFLQACSKQHPRLFALSIAGEGITPDVAAVRNDAGQGKASPALKKVMAHYAGAKSTGHSQDPDSDKVFVTVDVGGGVIEKFTVAGTTNNWLVVDFPIPK